MFYNWGAGYRVYVDEGVDGYIVSIIDARKVINLRKAVIPMLGRPLYL